MKDKEQLVQNILNSLNDLGPKESYEIIDRLDSNLREEVYATYRVKSIISSIGMLDLNQKLSPNNIELVRKNLRYFVMAGDNTVAKYDSKELSGKSLLKIIMLNNLNLYNNGLELLSDEDILPSVDHIVKQITLDTESIVKGKQINDELKKDIQGLLPNMKSFKKFIRDHGKELLKDILISSKVDANVSALIAEAATPDDLKSSLNSFRDFSKNYGALNLQKFLIAEGVDKNAAEAISEYAKPSESTSEPKKDAVENLKYHIDNFRELLKAGDTIDELKAIKAIKATLQEAGFSDDCAEKVSKSKFLQNANKATFEQDFNIFKNFAGQHGKKELQEVLQSAGADEETAKAIVNICDEKGDNKAETTESEVVDSFRSICRFEKDTVHIKSNLFARYLKKICSDTQATSIAQKIKTFVNINQTKKQFTITKKEFKQVLRKKRKSSVFEKLLNNVKALIPGSKRLSKANNASRLGSSLKK